MPAPAIAPLTPWLFTAGFGWIYYRRIRRQFGRQTYAPRRALFRLVLLALVACALVLAAAAMPHLGIGVAAGALVGVGLGWLAQRHMHVAMVDGKPAYTPNPWIGGALSLLLVSRIAWRWYHGSFATAMVAGNAAAPGMQASPLTFAFAAALIGYYLVSGIGLALRVRALDHEARASGKPDDGGGSGTGQGAG